MSAVCRHVLVNGRVQGVGFRWSTQRQARLLGLCGWVRNLPDGRVEAQFEGASAAVESMLTWLREGPPGALVEELEVREAVSSALATFEVRA